MSIKIGLLGTGNMGSNHLRILSLLKEVDLTFIYDLDYAKTSRLAKLYNTRATDDLDQALSEVEAVVIATPTFTHYDYINHISQSIKHIFVEKPLTDTPEKTAQIVDLVRQKELNLQVGFIERFNPAVVALKKAIANSKAINIDLTRTNKLSNRISDVDVVTDLMIHDIDLAVSFNGSVKEVHAYGMKEDGMIAFARATFKHANGAYSNITASRITEKRIRHIAVTCDDLFIDCNLLSKEVHINKQTIQQDYKDVFISSKQETINVKPEEALLSEIIAFLGLIRGESSSKIATAKHDLTAMTLAEKIKSQI